MLKQTVDRRKHFVSRCEGISVEVSAERRHQKENREIAENVVHVDGDETRELAAKIFEEVFQVFGTLGLFSDALSLKTVIKKLDFFSENFQGDFCPFRWFDGEVHAHTWCAAAAV